MNLDSVAIWHPSHSNGVVLGVWHLARHHREPVQVVCQPGRATHLIFWTRATKKMKSSALTRGSPMHTRFPWPRGTKWSGRKNFPSSSRNLFQRRRKIRSLLVGSSTSLVWIVQVDPTVLDRWGTSLCWSWQCCPRAQHALLAMWSGKSVKSLNIKTKNSRPPSL